MKGQSLRNKFIPKLLLILLPLVIFLNVYTFRISDLLREQAASSGSELSAIYIREIDADLSDLHRWLVNLSEDTEHLSGLSGGDPAAREMERKYFDDLLAEAVELYPAMDMAFVISTQSQVSVTASGKNVSFEEHEAFMELANKFAGFKKPFDTDWTAKCTPDNIYCICSTIVTEDAVMGVFVKPDTLLTSAPFAAEDGEHFVLAKHNGFIVMNNMPAEYGEDVDLTGDLSSYYLTGDRENIVVCGAESTVGPFRLMMITSDAELQRGIAWAKWISVALLAVSVITLAAVIVGFRKDVMQPLEKIGGAIKKLGEAQFDQHLAYQSEAREFADIYDTFNHMSGQIKTLKIANYEQVIRKQQAELRFYQTQIKPHFILNCLTTIQNLARQGKNEEAARFMADFGSFARYMFRTDYTLVSLRDELEQVGHYISMQELRFPGELCYVADADEDSLDFQLPAMLVQTLVENCVKHGMDEKEGLSIFVRCGPMKAGGAGGLEISVEDNGEGFPAPVLAALNNAGADQSALGFGLQNIRAVLELTYGGRAGLHAENVPGSGAKVVLTIQSE